MENFDLKKLFLEDGNTRVDSMKTWMDDVLSHTLQVLPVDSIEVDPEQVRDHIDDSELLELAESIKRYGLLQPVVVYKVGLRYRLLAGFRRFRAIKNILGEKLIRAYVIPHNLVIEKGKEILQYIENVQRVGLTIAEEAKVIGGRFKALYTERSYESIFGELKDFLKDNFYLWNFERVDDRIKELVTIVKSEFNITQNKLVVLLYLWCQDDEIRKYLSTLRNVGLSHYTELLRYGIYGEELLEIAKMIEEKNLSVRELKALLKLKKQKSQRETLSIEDKIFSDLNRYVSKLFKSKAIKDNSELRNKIADYLIDLANRIRGGY